MYLLLFQVPITFFSIFSIIHILTAKLSQIVNKSVYYTLNNKFRANNISIFYYHVLTMNNTYQKMDDRLRNNVRFFVVCI